MQALKQVGAYLIDRELGRGGMGIVYLGRDQRLGRSVAIKSLPRSLASDPMRAQRFAREARILASLSHPNVAAVYGVERSDGQDYLVMEYVTGLSLAELLAAGPMPVPEALQSCAQIAAALEAAHELGVVHRDLKPGNIIVEETPAGEVCAKVLDFGLAREAPSSQFPTPSQDGAASATSPPPLTVEGLPLGTPGYMSPEQARGKPVDKRTDIFSFGCVLFECLTGQRAFGGETGTDAMAAAMERDPDWSLLPENVPWRVREVLEVCLEKEPSKRLRDIGDARLELEKAIAGREWSGSALALQPAQRSARRGRQLVTALAGGAIVLVLADGVSWLFRGKAQDVAAPAVMHLSITPPEGTEFNTFSSKPLAISKDGKRVAFQGLDGLYVREMESAEPKKLEIVAFNPFFGRDDRDVGFMAVDWRMHRIRTDGGSPELLLNQPVSGGSTWSEGYTYFTPFFEQQGSLAIHRISDSGGTPEPVTQLGSDASDKMHVFPDLLPDGQGIIFTSKESWGHAGARIVAQKLDGSRRTIVAERAGQALYALSGHLIYNRQSALYAVPFDPERLEVTGPEVRILENVRYHDSSGAGHFDVSENGTLIYLRGRPLSEQRRTLWWVTVGGVPERAWPDAGPFVYPRLSPDGTRVASFERDPANGQWSLHVFDLVRQSTSVVVPGDGTVRGTPAGPQWMPAGESLVYTDIDSHNSTIWMVAADGSEPPTRIIDFEGGDAFPTSVGQDGRTVAVRVYTKDRTDLVLVDLKEKSVRPVALIGGGDVGVMSRDGRWLASAVEDRGRMLLYIQSIETPSMRWRVPGQYPASTPFWSADSTKLFFSSLDGWIYSVSIASEGDEPAPSAPERLLHVLDFDLVDWDVSADGQRFLMVRNESGSRFGVGSREIRVVFNYFEELKRKCPPPSAN